MKKLPSAFFLVIALGACNNEPETPRPDVFRPLDALATDNEKTERMCLAAERCLVTYLAPWCPTCRATLPLLGNVNRAIAQSPNVELIIVISALGREWKNHQSMVDALPDNAAILLDPQSHAWTKEVKQNLPGVPGWIVYSKDGEVLATMSGGSNQTSDEAVRGLLYEHLGLDSHMQF